VLEKNKSITRREFIKTGVKTAGLIGLGGVIGVTAFRATRKNSEKISEDPLQEYSAVDPALIKYREAGKIQLSPRPVQAVAVGPEDRIYIASAHTIQIFSKDAEYLKSFRVSDQPGCLTVTSDGSVYAGMRDHLEVYDAKGAIKARWDSLGQNAVLTSITVWDDNVFVADAGNRLVIRYQSKSLDTNGKLVRVIGKHDPNKDVPGFSVPSPYFDLKVSPDGLLRVANPGQHRVEAYTFDGNFEFAWGNPAIGIDGFCGCCNPVNFSILPDGSFVTCEKGVPRVKIYDAKGNFESVVAGADSFVENNRLCLAEGSQYCKTGGLDVTSDSKGRVLVMDPVEKAVRIFERLEKV